MDVVEKINYLINEKGMNKKEFSIKLQNLDPRLKSTGAIPNIQTIYGYLNGKREIKIELIPYISEVLGVQEQELFNFDIEYASEYNIQYSKEAREIVSLLPYVPRPFIYECIALLKETKKSYEHNLNEMKLKMTKLEG